MSAPRRGRRKRTQGSAAASSSSGAPRSAVAGGWFVTRRFRAFDEGQDSAADVLPSKLLRLLRRAVTDRGCYFDVLLDGSHRSLLAYAADRHEDLRRHVNQRHLCDQEVVAG